jgi:hypothetical protein
MRLLLEIPDKKASEVLSVLNKIPYIKMKPLDGGKSSSSIKTAKENKDKELFLEEFKQAIEEVNLIKAGKLKGIDAKELLNEL